MDSAPALSSSSTLDSTNPITIKILGVTSAINLSIPSLVDMEETEKLKTTLESFNSFETKSELNHRLEILSKLNELVKQWVRDVSIARNMPVQQAQRLGGHIYTFGSFGLGVYHKGEDIDALFVAPCNIERSDYFTSLVDFLKKQTEVTRCHAIEKGFVPLIKISFDSVEINLLFAKLSLREIPDDLDLKDDNLLEDLDPICVRSLNGCRITLQILSLVPNVKNFRLTLSAIKLWAKKRGIYSNSLGYLDDVAWSILVARTCQLYPTAVAATLVEKFFLVFSNWKWPGAVLLKYPENIDEGYKVWDPRNYVMDRYHLMPIITPAYPEQNSAFNVSESTAKVILNEFSCGLSMVDEIYLGHDTWDSLFEESLFFHRYKHFMVIFVASQTSDDHLKWCGLVESKIGLLVANLEQNRKISLVHINPKRFDLCKGNSSNNNSKSNKVLSSPFCSTWFIGLEFGNINDVELNIAEIVQNFYHSLHIYAATSEDLKKGIIIGTEQVKRKQLESYLDSQVLEEEKSKISKFNNLNNTAPPMKRKMSSESSEERRKHKKVFCNETIQISRKSLSLIYHKFALSSG